MRQKFHCKRLLPCLEIKKRFFFSSPKKHEWYKFNREAELERGRKYKEQTRRLVVSYPVINLTRTSNGNGIFTGVVAAAIRLETLGNFLKNQLFSPFKSTVGLLDRNGIILYAAGATQYIGANVLGNGYQSLSHLDPHDLNLLDDLIKKSRSTDSGDFLVNDKLNTIV